MKVLILGLDGATWRVLKPLINFDLLPNFKKIVKNGSTGILKSTIPPITIPAWPCMATGLNPGKLGVFSTLIRTSKNDFTLRPVRSTVYKGKSFWDNLSLNKYHVALIKIPFLYPVYEINGIMISGFGSTGKLAIYPKYLYKNIVNGPSELLERKLFERLEKLNLNDLNECRDYIIHLTKLMKEEAKIALELANNFTSDLFFYVISMTDWLHHAFMDRILNLISKFNRKNFSEIDIVDDEILKFYKFLDKIVERFLIFMDKYNDSIFFVVSDHGFTIRPFTFNIGKWLVKNGYMKIRSNFFLRETSPCSRINRIMIELIHRLPLDYILKFLPTKILSYFANLYFNMSSKMKINISQLIDYKNSNIFCLEDYAIYINTFNNNILDKMINNLENTLKKDYGLKLQVFKCKDIYKGKKIELAPDLILEINDNDYIWEKSIDLNKPLVFKPKLSGIHDRYGIFMAYGHQIKKNIQLDNLRIYDIAPTILHIFNTPLNTEFDGRVIKEIFKESSEIYKRTIHYQEEIPMKKYLLRRIAELKKH